MNYPYPIPRFHVTIFCIALLICWFGFKSLWELINKNNKVPRSLLFALQAVLLLLLICWFGSLSPYLYRLTSTSQQSVSVPFVTMGTICLIVLVKGFAYKARHLWPDLVVAAFLILMIISNQFILVRVVGNGQRDIEFKHLVDWYLNNAEPGEKLVTTVPIILQTMAPEQKDCFIHTRDIEGDNPEEFIQGCYQQNITYVTWDSRMGLTPKNHYYGYWKMRNIAPLGRPHDIGPYKFITQLKANKRRYVNIFSLQKIGN